MKRLLNQLHRADQANSFFAPGASVLVAFSGGPDSACLLLLLNALRASKNLRIAAAHVNHGLRGSASADERWARRFCERRGIVFYAVKVRVRVRSEKESESLEEAARRLRYRALLRIARIRKYSLLATAHTADDQAETVLMRLAGGSGLWGLAGIPASRTEGSVRIIRPLLGISKREVLDALRRSGTTYRVDRSNRSGRFLRNRLRNEILPLLRDRVNPRVDEHLADLAGDAAGWRRWAAVEAERFVKNAGRPGPARLTFEEASFRRLPEPLRAPVFMKIMERLSGREQFLRREHIRQIEELLASQEPGERKLAFGARVRRTVRGRVRRIVWSSAQSSPPHAFNRH